MPVRPVHSTLRTMIAVCVLALTIAFLASTLVLAKPPALQSWNDTDVTKAIEEFVAGVTTAGGPDFVPIEDRIAVFDMDGTLIVEQPMPAALVPVVSGVKAAVAADPSLAERPLVAAFMKGDTEAIATAGEAGLVELISIAVNGRNLDEVSADLSAQMVGPDGKLQGIRPYQPMLELVNYLEANGFTVWICSGSPVMFTRSFSEAAFGLPVQQIMGSSLNTRFVERDGKSQLVLGEGIDHINDKEGKPPTINLHVGKRPLLVGGNVRSGGDIAMMRYSHDRDGPSLQLLINHDDATREFAYSEPGDLSLNAARKYGFHVISMKDDWADIFPAGVSK